MFRRLPSLLVCLALAVPPAAWAEYQYQTLADLRQQGDNNADFQEAIGALPSSDLNGTLNRISALLSRSGMRDLPTDHTARTDLPANVKRNLAAALADLQVDLEAALDTLDGASPDSATLRHRSTILQLVAYVAVERPAQFYDDFVGLACEGWDLPEPTPCPGLDLPGSQIVGHLDSLGTQLAGWLIDFAERAKGEPSIDFLGEPTPNLDWLATDPAPSSVGATELVGAVRELHRATGVESIDYQRAIGVPSIDD
jgi:hypothetical protein